MRIIISDPTEDPTYLIVRIDQTNEFGAANTDAIQVIKLQTRDRLKLPIYFIGRLRFYELLDRWMISAVMSSETWDNREETEKALMMNNYTLIDFTDE